MNNKIMTIFGSLIFVVSVMMIIMFITGKNDETMYNVFFETNGGSLVETQLVNKGKQVKKPENPTKEGYVFVEWTYLGRSYDFSLQVTSDIILTASWLEVEEGIETFIVTFESDGGTTIPNQVVQKGSTVAKPIDPVKHGYLFKGWTLNNKIYDFDTIIEENIELNAKWEKVSDNQTTPITKKYTITFNSNGGTKINSQVINKGDKASKPANPTRTGYTFVGWTINGSVYDFNAKVNSDITLVAKWNENAKKKYTVTFNSNGGTKIDSQIVTEGDKALKPINPTKTGYTFVGWTINGSVYDFNTKVNSDITLDAKWNENAKKKYTVTFNSNGGSKIDSQIVIEGDKALKPINPTKTGYTFVGWTINGSVYDFNTKVNSDIVLDAKWNENNVVKAPKAPILDLGNGALSINEKTDMLTYQLDIYVDDIDDKSNKVDGVQLIINDYNHYITNQDLEYGKNFNTIVTVSNNYTGDKLGIGKQYHTDYITFENTHDGNYKITARAYVIDNNGNRVYSDSVSVSVTVDKTLPQLEIVNKYSNPNYVETEGNYYIYKLGIKIPDAYVYKVKPNKFAYITNCAAGTFGLKQEFTVKVEKNTVKTCHAQMGYIDKNGEFKYYITGNENIINYTIDTRN